MCHFEQYILLLLPKHTKLLDILYVLVAQNHRERQKGRYNTADGL
jgi:hypothetical protein